MRVLLFAPAQYNVACIAARRTRATNPWFKRWTLFREALGALRTVNELMTVTEIAHAVLAANNLTDVATCIQRARDRTRDQGGPREGHADRSTHAPRRRAKRWAANPWFQTIVR